MSDPLTFGSLEMEQQFYGDKLNDLLRRIVLNYAEEALNSWGWLFHVTSVIRTQAEDEALNGSGVHCTGRAVDVRTRNIPPQVVKSLAEKVNKEWVYDPDRPRLVVCYTEPHGTGPHAHFQVHAHTKRRG